MTQQRVRPTREQRIARRAIAGVNRVDLKMADLERENEHLRKGLRHALKQLSRQPSMFEEMV
jgi:hypothetical protein